MLADLPRAGYTGGHEAVVLQQARCVDVRQIASSMFAVSPCTRSSLPLGRLYSPTHSSSCVFVARWAMSCSCVSSPPPARSVRCMDNEAPVFTWVAKLRLQTLGTRSQPHRICGSTLRGSILVNASSERAGAPSHILAPSRRDQRSPTSGGWRE